MTVILGIDPGLVTTGYGLIEVAGRQVTLRAGGVISSGPAEAPLEVRLLELYTHLCDLLREHRPRALALEDLYSHYEHPKTAILMGHARGVIALAAAQFEVPVYHYGATQVKSILTGDGQASKTQVQRAIQHRFTLKAPPLSDHVADALALALCHSSLGESSLFAPGTAGERGRLP